jgi:hypothetical protein
MKISFLKITTMAFVATGLVWMTAPLLAQDSAAVSVQPATASASAPPLAYGVPQILKLKQAEVGDDTVIAYIKNSGNSYGLDADQIIYLRQQGISDAVLKAMLQQPKLAAAPVMPAAPELALQSATATAVAPVAVDPVAPPAMYIQTVPATTYYYQPYYYPVYSCFPAVSFSFGWGGGWHGGWHGGGGYYGGWHGGVGWHGGGWHH